MKSRMISWLHWILPALFISVAGNLAQAGPFTDPGVPGRVADPGNPGATIVNPELRAWAGAVVEYSPAPGINAANGDATKALGPIGATTGGRTVSLGDLTAAELAAGLPPGEITLAMDRPLYDGAGWDLAVFENGFPFFPPDDDKLFAELAYVEVSSDGVTFARFPSASLTTTLFTPFGPSFAGIVPTDVHNLAGKHVALVGAAFDFADLAATDEVLAGDVRLDAIRFVRIVDIPGSGEFLDAAGRGILEAWPTTDLEFGDGGFDLDAVAGRYAVPEPSGVILTALGILGMTLVKTAGAQRRKENPSGNFAP